MVVVQNSGCALFFGGTRSKVTNSAKKVFFVFQQEMNHILTTDFHMFVFFLRGGGEVTGKFSGSTVLI